MDFRIRGSTTPNVFGSWRAGGGYCISKDTERTAGMEVGSGAIPPDDRLECNIDGANRDLKNCVVYNSCVTSVGNSSC
jgi:hypothetical protein